MSQLTAPPTSDASLALQSTAGDKSAFTQLVQRYQSLICAIAYNATGNLAHSEDLSQEIFIAAWKQLPSLRQPAHFRPWLCGIARNLINNARRSSLRHPTQSLAAPVDSPIDPPAPTQDPAASAISREEESLLWRSLERIPDSCREPLILFYR
ncbi:MAG: RNA polymerase sigma factor [Phycisphaerae bacterium]